MYRISEDEIDFMLEDMETRGVGLKDLQENLIDHLCCIIEDEMEEDENFKDFYNKILPRFFKTELSELQTETNQLLKFKNFYSMIKTLKLSGIATVFFTLAGTLLKTFHLPGAGVMLVLGGFFLSIVFLPLLIVIKFKDENSKIEKAVFSFGLVVGIILAVGLIFKLMHWPFANILMIGSTVTFTFIYVPLYFFTRFNKAEMRFNTIVNTVLMFTCGGIFFALFDLNFSQKFETQIKDNHFFIHENAEKLFASNNRLYSSETPTGAAENMHTISGKVNDQIEVIAAVIVDTKSTKQIQDQASTLSSLIGEYNSMVQELNNNEIQLLSNESTLVLERLSPKLALNSLARIQQQLAVNENCYLTALLAKK